MLTIRFLATGETFRSLSYQFRISERTISYIIEQVTKAIAHYVGKYYIKTPSSQQQWLEISEIFNSRWNFPNCIGAVEGKHELITPPPGTGSEFFNYKKTFSVILLAVAGPEYECLYADIGSNGRMNDSGVWNKSDLHQKIDNNALKIPVQSPLRYGNTKIPYVLVGDDAFAFKDVYDEAVPAKKSYSREENVQLPA